ncbi:anti-sigma factor family protein [Paraburkholderia tagetis]|uniref:Anti-sigma factor n=1 Tax=Paraburkholderia tagetis TaxID=2913261 RepID=A0A9X1RKF6_9BURK|nr:anti-sigma factor [Paraburkholderia tagetis]MCG5073921.1 anti-sigma factor [Paraburkholderia tagetis]
MNDDELERERASAHPAPAALPDGGGPSGPVPPQASAAFAAFADSDADLAALSAWLDDELPADARAAIQARLATDEHAAQRVAAWRAQKAALQTLCRAGDEADSPGYVVLRRRDPWWRRAGLAAAWAVVGAGFAMAAGALMPQWLPDGAWATRGNADAGRSFALDSLRDSAHDSARDSAHDSAQDSAFLARDAQGFARRADVAYAVYSPEVRHPVEVGAADEAHLVAWLSKRLGTQLAVPPLGEYGYALVGGRLLPGAAGPAAQFMYQNHAGARLTLYVSASGRDRDAVHLLSDGSSRTFYWSTKGMGYALSGPASEARLRTIAYEVCGALGGTPAQW